MISILSVPKGQLSVLVVGGVFEMLNHGQKDIKLCLERRKGFIKLALRFGRPLVPIFGFGENFLFNSMPNEKGTWLRKMQDWLEPIMALPPIFFFGRGVFQYTLGALPRRVPITLVVGKPIEVEKTDEPSKELIEATHKK